MGAIKTFLFEYPWNGGVYCLEIRADDRAEAEARFKAIPWGAYKGEVLASGRLPWFSWPWKRRP